jgi:16S rRNA (adenine1518-N6/adenine1519-N6)-dimethyltransferase
MKIADKNTILSTLTKLQAAPLKRLGQNFLSDETVAERIVKEITDAKDGIPVEVGPGLGALTHYLAEKGSPLHLYEIDQAMVNHLTETYRQQSYVTVHFQDILKADLASFNQPVHLIGNLPYYITSPIIEYVLLNTPQLRQMVIMVQEEVIERLTAKVGDKNYGPLIVLLNYLGNGNLAFKVRKHCFYPAPHVDSAIFIFKVRENVDASLVRPLFTVAQTMFHHRRKTVLNNLMSLVRNKEKAVAILGEINVDSLRRPETLTVAEYVLLTKALSKDKSI